MDDTSVTLGGKRYFIDVNAYTLERIRKELGIDVLKMFEDKGVLERLGEGANFIDAMFICTEDDCQRHGTTDPVAFAKLFKSGDILEEASRAFRDALVNFIPSHQREPLRKLMAMERAAEEKLRQKAMEMIESGKVDDLMDLQLQTLEDRFSTAVESLESQIRDGVLSEN